MIHPVPEITIVPDYLDCPYGHIHEKNTDKPSHLAYHPGMVQHRNVLLATTAINVQDTLDGYDIPAFGPLYSCVSSHMFCYMYMFCLSRSFNGQACYMYMFC